MRLTCVFTVSSVTVKRAGDLQIGQPIGDQPQDLRLARGERRKPGSTRAVRPWPLAGELADEAAVDGRGEQLFHAAR
jgi:hypothetical protein